MTMHSFRLATLFAALRAGAVVNAARYAEPLRSSRPLVSVDSAGVEDRFREAEEYTPKDVLKEATGYPQKFPGAQAAGLGIEDGLPVHHPTVFEMLAEHFGAGADSRDEAIAESGFAAEVDAEDEDDGGAEILADMFRAFDKDANGKIDLAELLDTADGDEDAPDGMARLVATLFSVADEDGDGALDRAEAERFMELLDEHAPEDIAEPDEEMAQHADDNEALDLRSGDDSVHQRLSKIFGPLAEEALDEEGLEEFAGLLTGVAASEAALGGEEGEGVAPDAMAEIFRTLDGDGDGKIELKTLLEAAEADDEPGLAELVKRLFAIADADLDGGLGRAEAATFMEMLDEQWPATSELSGPIAEEAEPDADDEEGDDAEGAAIDGAEMADEGTAGEDADDFGEDVLAEIFRSLAEEGDGKIRLASLLEAARRDEEPGLEELVERVFAVTDADLDGSLDRVEAEHFLELLDAQLQPLPAHYGGASADEDLETVGEPEE